jgi:tetratricopeptide (TPR) repeat protein
MYDSKNAAALARKDRIYVSLSAEDIRSQPEKLGKLIDQAYLSSKARQLLDLRNAGPEQYQWGQHLAELLKAAAPERPVGWVLSGRIHLRLGQAEAGVQSLETAYRLGKEKKPGGEDLEAWYLACRILGDHYLQQQQFSAALECFEAFSQSTKSGADTLFKLGQASEHLGEFAKAKKYYESANMFDHPNKYEVTLALERLAAKNG